MKTLFEQKIEEWNRIKPAKYPTFSFSFVGETSPAAELEVQTNIVFALMDIDIKRIYT